MSADSVKAALRTLDSFLAYYTTPINILPVTQGQGGTSLGLYGTATGLIQVGVGVVQMIGKSVLMPVNAGATVLSLSSSVLNMRKTFTDTAPGTIKVSDFAAAMSSVVSLVGIAAAAVPAALPLAATIAVTSAVISSALTGARSSCWRSPAPAWPVARPAGWPMPRRRGNGCWPMPAQARASAARCCWMMARAWCSTPTRPCARAWTPWRAR